MILQVPFGYGMIAIMFWYEALGAIPIQDL
jgi:hypothetical protein